uniref:Reverse transcriptase domain-containing protein n=1 Tax=Xenopus tropicalis TaxID=8364 RepID=A0A803JYC0_XENTR
MHLDRDIPIEEIEEAIADMPPGRTPGPDCLPAEWYKAHSQTLSPKLCTLYNNLTDTNVLPESCYMAHITLIPKVGKPSDDCGSYRPISLLNCDAKIFAKVLANRLKQIVRSIIHPDQTGFMPQNATDINIRRLFNNLEYDHDNKGKRIVVSLDTAKAFDTVSWGYLWEILRRFGLGGRYRAWVRALYWQPQVRVLVNGRLTDPLPLERGTRQGCPLSPLLFALVIEPLATLLRDSPNIPGLQVGRLIEKVSLYADDMLLYLANPNEVLSNALSQIEEFGIYSGLRVNQSKSLIFPIDPLPPPQAKQIEQLQVVQSFKYLGVVINKQHTKFEEGNLTPIVQNLSNKIDTWAQLPLTLPGRINLLKMVFLPKLLYIFHNSPVPPRAKWYKRIDSLILRFLWAGEHPRISLKTLQAPVTQGGLALPNMRLYYLASQLIYVHWWLTPHQDNTSTLLEANILGSLEALANLPYRGNSKHYTTTTPMRTVITAFQKALRHVQGPQQTWSRWTPLWGNCSLPNFISLPNIAQWASHGIKHLQDILTNGDIKHFQTLRGSHQIPQTMHFNYLQLRHAFHSQFPTRPVELQETTLEKYIRRENLTKALSWYYTILWQANPDPLAKVREKWMRDIPNLTEETWVDALRQCCPTGGPRPPSVWPPTCLAALMA